MIDETAESHQSIDILGKRNKAVLVSKQAQKDAKKLASSGLKPKAQELLDLIAEDPHRKPPPFEKLVGDLTGACLRRINIQHPLVYQVLEGERLPGAYKQGTLTP